MADAELHGAPRLRHADVPAEAATVQQELIAELLFADVLLIGPLYNYSMPSPLKAWIDHIHVPGTTATFDVTCLPLAGRPAVIVTTRAGIYDSGSANDGRDHAVPPLELILGKELGMAVTVVAVGRTLAGRLPAPGGDRACPRRAGRGARPGGAGRRLLLTRAGCDTAERRASRH